jgi:hypothetical protein
MPDRPEDELVVEDLKTTYASYLRNASSGWYSHANRFRPAIVEMESVTEEQYNMCVFHHMVEQYGNEIQPVVEYQFQREAVEPWEVLFKQYFFPRDLATYWHERDGVSRVVTIDHDLMPTASHRVFDHKPYADLVGATKTRKFKVAFTDMHWMVFSTLSLYKLDRVKSILSMEEDLEDLELSVFVEMLLRCRELTSSQKWFLSPLEVILHTQRAW